MAGLEVRRVLRSLVKEVSGLLIFFYICIALMAWQIYIFVYTKLSEWFPMTARVVSGSISRAHAFLAGKNSRKHVLIALPYSSFCEKVRWTYDMAGEPYKEWSVGLMFHYFISLFQTRGASHAVPILVTHPNHRILPTSHASLRYLGDLNKERFGEDWIFPNKDTEDFEMSLSAHGSYGHATMSCVFYYLFTASNGAGKAQLLQVCKRGVPKWQSLLLPFLWPGCEIILKLTQKVDDQSTFKTNMEIVDETWTKVHQLLSDGRKYLYGTRQASGADIAFAALSYPLVLPPEMESKFFSYERDQLPSRYRKAVERRRNTSVGKFVLRLFKEERHKTFQS